MASNAFKALTVHYKDGERVVAAGERGACMFVVQAGEVRLLRPSGEDGGVPTEIALLERGDFFGEGALLEGRPYPSTAEAVGECEIVEFGAGAFERMLRANPEIAVRLMRKLSMRLERLEVRLLQASDQGASKTDDAPATPPPAKSTSSTSGRLVVESGEAAFPMTGNELLVGRYDPVTEIQPEIDLTSVDTKRSVSRRHARLSHRNGAWHVQEEVGVLNGTFVNGARLDAGRSRKLVEGDVLSMGMVRLVFREK